MTSASRDPGAGSGRQSALPARIRQLSAVLRGAGSIALGWVTACGADGGQEPGEGAGEEGGAEPAGPGAGRDDGGPASGRHRAHTMIKSPAAVPRGWRLRLPTTDAATLTASPSAYVDEAYLSA